MTAPDSRFATVRTAQGLVRGRREGEGGVFLGIPFAAPPVGPLRWRPPQPMRPWSGVRDALDFGPDMPQPPMARLRGPRQDEDALYLNVWTPTIEGSAGLPVLVWFPGGGFLGGSASDPVNDGARLAAEGAVVVAINYRVGLFGFLAHPALGRESENGVSGNYGLQDQVAALRWIRDNIAAFGGDPERVTPFGVSAGSASIALLLTAPSARGLFQRAILQSAGAGRPLATLEEAERAGLVLGEDLEALRALPTGEILARNALFTPEVRALTRPRVLRPIHDGCLLPRDECAALRAQRFEAMPLIVGTNRDEGSWATKAWPIESLPDWRDQAQLNFGTLAKEAERLYPARQDSEAHAAVAAMFADTQFNHGARLWARGMAAREPRTWRYLFTRRRPDQQDGPHHSDEVPYVFGNLPADAAEAAERDQELSRTMRQAWVRFAGSGDPNGGEVAWPAYEPAEDNYLELGDAIRTGARWRQAQLDFIERYYG
jgi:para-nitrobenzyl esterase